MAELILSDEDKAAARWLQMSDESVGRLVKYTQVAILRDADEQKRVWWWSAMLLLVSLSHEANSEASTFQIEGVTIGNVPIGDWEVVVRRRSLVDEPLTVDNERELGQARVVAHQSAE